MRELIIRSEKVQTHTRISEIILQYLIFIDVLIFIIPMWFLSNILINVNCYNNAGYLEVSLPDIIHGLPLLCTWFTIVWHSLLSFKHKRILSTVFSITFSKIYKVILLISLMMLFFNSWRVLVVLMQTFHLKYLHRKKYGGVKSRDKWHMNIYCHNWKIWTCRIHGSNEMGRHHIQQEKPLQY